METHWTRWNWPRQQRVPVRETTAYARLLGTLLAWATLRRRDLGYPGIGQRRDRYFVSKSPRHDVPSEQRRRW